MIRGRIFREDQRSIPGRPLFMPTTMFGDLPGIPPAPRLGVKARHLVVHDGDADVSLLDEYRRAACCSPCLVDSWKRLFFVRIFDLKPAMIRIAPPYAGGAFHR